MKHKIIQFDCYLQRNITKIHNDFVLHEIPIFVGRMPNLNRLVSVLENEATCTKNIKATK